MKESDKPKPEPKPPTYADKGDHGKRHDYQEGVKKEVHHCGHNCTNCPLAKSCQK